MSFRWTKQVLFLSKALSVEVVGATLPSANDGKSLQLEGGN